MKKTETSDTPDTRPGGGGGGGTTRYTVTFDTQGGSGIDSIRVNRNGTVTKPADPTREGYTFGGWFTDKECTEAFDFDTKVTKNLTLYAKWTEDGAQPTPPPSEWKNPFADVAESDWFYDAVRYANENGLFAGVSDTEFAPDTAMTRGMLVTGAVARGRANRPQARAPLRTSGGRILRQGGGVGERQRHCTGV